MTLGFMFAGGWLALVIAAATNPDIHPPVAALAVGPILAASLFGGAYIIRKNGKHEDTP